jgi:hypothetical protein
VVIVNGEPRPVVTPTEILLEAGTAATIGAQLDGYLTRETTVTPSATNPAPIDLTLEVDRASSTAPIGSLRVTFTPPDASVYLDGQAQSGASPITLENLRLNTEITLRFEKDGFETLYHTVRLDSDEMLDVQLAMSEAVDLGRWTITSEPSGATVRIDDTEVGVTPIENLELVANRTYTLEVVRSGFPRYRVQRQVRAGEIETIDVNLARGQRATEEREAPSAPTDAPAPQPSGPAATTAAPEPEPAAEPEPEEPAEPAAEERPRYRIIE